MTLRKADVATQRSEGDGARLAPQAGDALLIIDPQNDFLPGGALAAPGGDAVIAPLNEWIARFSSTGLPILATRDWHPPNHCSFHEQGGPWPAHCVAGTAGAMITAALALPPEARIVDKPGFSDVETYCGFAGTTLDAELRRAGIQRLWVGGLATDYCVLNTVLAARERGYAVVLLITAMRAVDIAPGDGPRALRRMREHGALVFED